MRSGRLGPLRGASKARKPTLRVDSGTNEGTGVRISWPPGSLATMVRSSRHVSVAFTTTTAAKGHGGLARDQVGHRGIRRVEERRPPWVWSTWP